MLFFRYRVLVPGTRYWYQPVPTDYRRMMRCMMYHNREGLFGEFLVRTPVCAEEEVFT